MVEEFNIMLATIDDMKTVFDLSNDELVRENSFNSEKIEWEKHQIWFRNKLSDGNCIFYLAKDFSGKLISQLRFDKTDEEGDISISVARDFRGKGHGTKILKLVSEKVISEYGVKKINAYVKIGNKVSRNMFKKAGYILKCENSERAKYEYISK